MYSLVAIAFPLLVAPVAVLPQRGSTITVEERLELVNAVLVQRPAILGERRELIDACKLVAAVGAPLPELSSRLRPQIRSRLFRIPPDGCMTPPPGARDSSATVISIYDIRHESTEYRPSGPNRPRPEHLMVVAIGVATGSRSHLEEWVLQRALSGEWIALTATLSNMTVGDVGRR